MSWTISFKKDKNKIGIGHVTATWTEEGKPDFVYPTKVNEAEDNSKQNFKTKAEELKDKFYATYDLDVASSSSLQTYMNL